MAKAIGKSGKQEAARAADAPRDALPAISAENRLGPYRLVRKLGEGGMGIVYLGFDEALDRAVAIKVLRAGQTGKIGATLAKRFLREAKSAARVSHPHVVTIHTVGEHAEQPYLVMEYVDGGTLAEHLRRFGPMHWREATAAVRDALRGLAAAHHKGVIHRDIKPANLMRAKSPAGEDVIKLADFGLARVVAGPMGGGDGELTFPGAFVGSPSYASPEQVAGVQALDGRADLYSLAATWYALLTGQPPFVEDDAADVMQRQLHDAFPDARVLAPTVNAGVIAVIAKASRKKAEERYASAAAMLEAVERLLAMPGEAVPLRETRGAIDGGAGDTVVLLEKRLAAARAQHDSTTQIATLRTLHALYAQLDRRPEAMRAFQEALALHIKMMGPRNN